jgi:hypothetical protein
MSEGIPKFPPNQSQFGEFFTSRNTFQHLNVKQFSWLSSYINKDGRMIEKKETIPGLRSEDKKSKGSCRECTYGRRDEKKVSTILDVHAPLFHVWESKTRDIQQCPKCGIPLELFENEELFQHHIQKHVPSPILNEEYYPDDNEGNVDLVLRVSNFIVDLQSEIKNKYSNGLILYELF